MASVFLVVGAPAVGKSTTARALAKQFPRSIHIPVDDLRDMVVSGLVYPGGDWGPELVEQLRLARETAAQMATSYNRAGFAVVIDDFWDPYSQLLEYGPLLQEPNLCKVLLFPSLRVAQERNEKRSGPGEWNEYLADGIRRVYGHLETYVSTLEENGWIIVDTSDQSVEAAVSHILVQAG